MKRLCLPALLLLIALPALAQEQKIREALEPKLGVKVEGVQPSPLPGIYEVRLQTLEGPKIVYSDEKGSYVFTGRLIDVKAERDLTEERLQKLSSIEFNQLPLDMAVKIQRGNGKRVLAMFSDPYCPYCRRLEQTLLQIDDLTVYVFMYPVIRPDLADHSRAVWCSKDRAKAWLELAANDRPKVPTASASCANPVDKVLELGRSLRVNGTPTLYFANGEKASGGMEIAALRKKLDEVAKAK
ncbi:MAG TPA: DsbC family protein [Burkholderiales bacterium]|jgi:thiol:disulfide interchange protein DsbC|nr:DsbC family protein [Burkholderiales bacterium]